MSKPIPAPAEMLIIWGLRVDGGNFESLFPCDADTGHIQETDEMAVVHYVQSVEGFERARPVLAWVHCDPFRALDEMVWWQPGVHHMRTASELGWAGHLLSAGSPRKVARCVYDEFMDRLIRLCGTAPFRYPERPNTEIPDDVQDPGETASRVSFQVEIKHAGGRKTW